MISPRSILRDVSRLLALTTLFTPHVQSTPDRNGPEGIEPTNTKNSNTQATDAWDLYWPEQHDCPLPCTDYANIHSWIPYLSLDRLARCKQPMLLQFSVSTPLDGPDSTPLIRSCSLPSNSSSQKVPERLFKADNPKLSESLYEPGILTASACRHNGTASDRSVYFHEKGAARENNLDTASILEGMKTFFSTPENCDESFVFAYSNDVVAGVYIGKELGKATATSSLQGLVDHFRQTGRVKERTTAQSCMPGLTAEHVFGVTIDTTRDLAAVQKTALRWKQGRCARSGDSGRPLNAWRLPGSGVWEITPPSALDEFSSQRGEHILTRIGTRFYSLKQDVTEMVSSIRTLFSGTNVGQVTGVDRNSAANTVPNMFTPSSTHLTKTTHTSNGLALSSDLSSFGTSPSHTTLGDIDALERAETTETMQDSKYLAERQTSSTCRSHILQNGDTCFALAEQYDVSVDDIESWNAGKTWGWQSCDDLLIGYLLCVGPGGPPMPAPQQGTQCGPLVPGTSPPADASVSLADLNPCPLKACCTNWGFCGVFPDHCDVNAPPNAAPGAKDKDAKNTCISNCGTNIVESHDPPAQFGRVGYYSAFAYDRECLRLPVKEAWTDASYTIIHWAFAEIDPTTWEVLIKDPGNQWEDFKSVYLPKRVISFGGWAYSTEPATYNIIRQAILVNYEAFTDNIVRFLQDHNLDGIDIDWEYPGIGSDNVVNGQPIGDKNDGELYLRFLRVLREKLGNTKILAISAPASYWYLKAFPIDAMATVVDYIVYMTYDLHGQWDYGNPNSFDNCDSGKCLRSHVNLTETVNTLSMITKAGVPTNKIFVGEASYGRSFHMADPDCWWEMCEFTGSRIQSDAAPGRCTGSSGYLAMAEIEELMVVHGDQVRTYHDSGSNSDILLYDGDHISYMTKGTKDTRRAFWRKLNFAGSADWALDLQAFSTIDAQIPADIPGGGEEGCIGGLDRSLYTGSVCEFTCTLGFCPPQFCECSNTGDVPPRPSEHNLPGAKAVNDEHVIINQLCAFSCKYGYCPIDICIRGDGNSGLGNSAPERGSPAECVVYQDLDHHEETLNDCLNFCADHLEKARDEGRTTNYGCLALGTPDGRLGFQWREDLYGSRRTVGRCLCDNYVINEIADAVMEALPSVAQVGCAILMTSLEFVVTMGVNAFPPGRAVHAGLDALLTATQMINHVYPEDQHPGEAFDWWLSPCGGDDLVPETLRHGFNIMSLVSGNFPSSFRAPKNIPRGSGRKGDTGNPKDQTTPRTPATTTSGPANTASVDCHFAGTTSACLPTPTPKSNVQCRNPGVTSAWDQNKEFYNVLRRKTCGQNRRWTMNAYTVTSLEYPVNGIQVTSTATCGVNSEMWPACRHYSSAIRVRPSYATITCTQDQAKVLPATRVDGPHVPRYSRQHSGAGWMDPSNRPYTEPCQIDEYPPAYLLGKARISSTDAQLVRYLPASANGRAGVIWKGMCMREPLARLSPDEIARRVRQSGSSTVVSNSDAETTRWTAKISVDHIPVFTMGSWLQPTQNNDGLDNNGCWPSKIAPRDPGFALLDEDPYNLGRQRPGYDYRRPYVPGKNGV